MGTNHLLSVEKKPRYPPGPGSSERWDFTPTAEEIAEVEKRLGGDLEVPYNFEQTALAFKWTGGRPRIQGVPQPQATTNRQTTIFCSKLGIYDPMALLLGTATARPSMAGLSLSSYSSQDSTMAAASARLASLTPSVIADKELLEKRKEESGKKEEEGEKVKLAIPAPKEEASNQDFLAVLDSIGNGSVKTKESEERAEESNVESINDMFVIDKNGAGDEEEVKPPPVKQLKRRNASMYASNDE